MQLESLLEDISWADMSDIWCVSIDIIFEADDIILFVAIAIENSDSTNSNKHTIPCFLAERLTLFKTNGGMNKVLYFE
ncbi:hypothetical protein D104_09095 [Marinomonas profundimaris]|uniref:Uncharacterized protein n=1 Tax=Marinomonas profundimaris TaxID=1208321 RepID=W1RUJ7_9GAMM|nr:hypothetical protein D104_09095 [Marinomonas profundimaris]